MAKTFTINSVDYTMPEQGETTLFWGTPLVNWMEAITNNALLLSGGNLTSELDFGDTFGIVAPYIKSATANPASAGFLRLANSDVISWRNTANDGDLNLALSGDLLQFDGDTIALLTATQTLTNKTLSNPSITGLTASRALETDGSGNLAISDVTSAELNYLDGVTSAIQTQLNSKITDPMTTNGDIIIENSGPSRLAIGSANQVLKVGAGGLPEWDTLAGTGDVVGPASATDNAIARFDTTTGKLLQNSGVTIDDSNNVDGINDLTAAGDAAITGALSVTSQSAPGRFKQFITVDVADMTSGAYVYEPDADVKSIKVTGVGGGAGGGSAQATGGSQVSGGGLGGGGSAFIKWYKREDLTPNPITVASADIDNAADTFTFTAHGFETGREVRLTTSDTLPAGLSVDTSYYIIRDDADTFKLASSRANAMAGTQIDITTDGVGDQTVTSHGAIHAIGVVGAGGAGGSAAGANGGGAGGATNFKIAQADGAGESFAIAASAVSGTYFASGTTLAPEASGGDLNLAGSAGSIDVFISNNWTRAMSGASPFAGSVRSSNSNTAVGEDGKFPGGGGSNARNGTSQSGRAGGDGADGVIWIEEFY